MSKRERIVSEKTVNMMFNFLTFFSILLVIEVVFIFVKKYMNLTVGKNIHIFFNITIILFFIDAIIAAILQIVYWFRQAFAHLSKYQGVKCFESIDFLNRNLVECNEYYSSRIREINRIYYSDLELKNLVEEENLDVLYARKSYLENQLDFYDNTMQVVTAFGISLLVIFIESGIGADAIIIIVCAILTIVGLCLAMIAKYIGKGRGDSYTHNIHEYELELLNNKIHIVNRNLEADEQIEKILEMRQTIINSLSDIYISGKKRRMFKLRKKDIISMSRIMYDLPLLKDLDKTYIVWAKKEIYGRDCFFPLKITNGQYICLNEAYEEVYRILEKLSL